MTCQKCGMEMITAQFRTSTPGHDAYVSVQRDIWSPRKTSPVTCFVCPICGYIEFTADQPQNLMIQ